VIIDRTKIVSALESAKEKSVLKMDGKPDKVRKFNEAVDLILNMRDLDIKNPNNRIEQEHMFPHPVHDDRYKVCFFAAGDMEMDIKKRGIAVVDSDALDTLAKKPNKDKKELAKKYDYFVSTSDLMRNVAKVMARFLGQRNKMPKPQPKGFGVISSNENLDEYLQHLKCVVKLDMKKQLLLQVKVGHKSQDSTEIMENVDSLLAFLGSKLPNGTNNIKSMYLKTTMGASVKIEEGSKK
jgi:large subunit ribosomal protein L1